MAGFGGLIGGIGGAVGDMFSAKADQQEAAGYFQAAQLNIAAAEIENQNIGVEKLSVQIQDAQMNRKIAKTEGAAVAAEGGANVSGGSAGDIMRESVSQGALALSLINTQGAIQENAFAAQALGFKATAAQDNATGAALETKAKGAGIAGMFSILGGIAGMF